MNLLLIGVALFFAAGLVAIPLPQKRKGIAYVSFAASAQIFILPLVIKALLGSPTLNLSVHFSGPIGDVTLLLDPLAAFFMFFISLGGLLAGIYSLGYMKMYQDSDRHSLSTYYFFMGLLVVAMLLVVIVQNALFFLIVWEIMSLASFFLVSFEHQKEEVRKAGLYYLIAMQIGAAALLVAFGWSTVLTGSMDFGALSTLSPAAATFVFILFFIGFGTKAGFVPLHTWLPLAHPAAPTAVSAMMSGVMIKTGIYGILRIILIIGVPSPWLAYLVFGIALLSGLLGVIHAIAQHDLKKLLAYHSIENIGIIGLGIGVGMLGIISGRALIAVAGFLGALLHVFNHFTFKSLLFYGAGIIYSKTHTRNIDQLGGLVRVLPYTAALFLIGSLAISGLPLLSGFVSEFAVYFGMAQSLSEHNIYLNVTAGIGLAGLALIGTMAALCFTKVFSICFLGNPRTSWQGTPSEASSTMLAPMIVLASFIVFIGLFTPLILPFLSGVVKQFCHESFYPAWNEILDIFLEINGALLIFGGLILFFIGLRWMLLRNKTVALFKTWDCGYQAQSSRIQYTASSFACSFLRLAANIVPQKKHIVRPQGLFPTQALYESHSDDLIARWMIRPLVGLLHYFLGLLSWIQSGHTQQYILYGLVFLVMLVIWVIGVR
ncbi:MAG: proton-conducting transporter membrane subunit [Candidatus Latescibacterota bacterium]